jgi:hypothetical protein
MKRKPILGEILYSLNVGNAFRHGVEQKLTPMIVHSVGRKYFALKHLDWNSFVEFHIDTWRQKTQYCEDHKLYETEQDWLNEKEERQISQKIWKTFEYGRNTKNLSLQDLRIINEILVKYENII